MHKWLYVLSYLFIFFIVILSWNFFISFFAMGIGDVNPLSTFAIIVFFTHSYLTAFIGASLSAGIITLWKDLNREQINWILLRSSVLIVLIFFLHILPIHIPFLTEIFMFGSIKQILVQYAGFIIGAWLCLRPHNKAANI